MKVIGIDPGSRMAGYGVVEKGRTGLLNLCHGVIELDPQTPLSARLFEISRAVSLLIAEHMPDAVSVETVFYSKNVKSAVILGHVRGACLLAAAASNVSVFEYAPAMIKQAVTGYGRADKAQVQRMVRLLLKLSEEPEPDAADALASAICHIQHSNRLSVAGQRLSVLKTDN